MSVIDCQKLTKQYKEKVALNAMTLSIEENKIIGLIGRNGAGKTTFLKMCAGLLKPTSGEIKIWNEKVFDNLSVLSKVILVDEEIQYALGLKLNDILYTARYFYPKWNETFARKLLDYFDLKGKYTYSKLSRGMKTQFNIIMGLSSRMPLTLFDEPTSGLDIAVRKEFYRILLKDYMNHPRTIILSSHLISEIENLLEEIVLIKDGELVLHASTDQLQKYGILLNGNKDILEQFTKTKSVLCKEEMGKLVKIGIKNDLTQGDYNFLKEHRVNISNLNTEDVCIYLTKSNKEVKFDGF